jgi:hypothetical protein
MSHNQAVSAPVPADEYRERLAARRDAHRRLDDLDRRLSYTRLATFALAAVLVLLTWQAGVTAWLLLVPVAAFIVLVRRHERVIQARDGAARAAAFYERGIARIEDR